MIVLTTTLFLHVLAKHGILDAIIYLFIVYCIWKPC